MRSVDIVLRLFSQLCHSESLHPDVITDDNFPKNTEIDFPVFSGEALRPVRVHKPLPFHPEAVEVHEISDRQPG
jgi:hypothetical protein